MSGRRHTGRSSPLHNYVLDDDLNLEEDRVGTDAIDESNETDPSGALTM